MLWDIEVLNSRSAADRLVYTLKWLRAELDGRAKCSRPEDDLLWMSDWVPTGLEGLA
jgi:hypothetical protein